MNPHEQGFVEFLVEPSRRRMRELLTLGAKRRLDVRALLDHQCRFEPRFTLQLTGQQVFPAPIAAMLVARGAPAHCHVVSANAALDGRDMRLVDALSRVVGMGDGTYLSCIPGRLGFFEFAERQSSCLLTR